MGWPTHSSTLAYPPQSLTQVPAPTNKRSLESVLDNMVLIIRRGQNLRLINVVDTESLKNLALNEVTYPGLGHHGDGDCSHDLLDELWVGHTCNAALDTNVCGYTLEGHDGRGTSLFSNAGLGGILALAHDLERIGEGTYLLSIDNIHDHTTLQHTGETGLDVEVGTGSTLDRAIDGEFGCHSVAYKVLVRGIRRDVNPRNDFSNSEKGYRYQR